jgi:16S rRNA (cytosine967-C5)-methyltransferase
MAANSFQKTARALDNNALTVRRLALQILYTQEQTTRTLDSVIEDTLKSKIFSDRRDRALLNVLVFGILRWRGRLDFVIQTFSHIPLKKIDARVLNILRLGLFQILHLDRIPVSAAVNTSVELAKLSSPPWVVRYVNAILRNAARGQKNIQYPDITTNPLQAIAARKSFPQWLIRRWLDTYGPDETVRRCDAINTIPPLTLRTNTLHTNREKLLQSLGDHAESVQPTKIAPDGVLLQNPDKPIPDFAAFEKGWFQVQDEAAQLVTLLLNPRPGEKILDACAGLGGKTGHIAQLMINTGLIIALDKHKTKLVKLNGQMQRMGVSIVSSAKHDLNKALLKEKFGTFDRILLDAPCSGLGVLRRNPDSKWNIKEQMLKNYGKNQVRFLNNLAHLVNRTGIMVFSVCSSEPEEGEWVSEQFLKSHPEFVIESPSPALPIDFTSFITREGYLKTSPHQHDMDGFFAVCFKRI